MGILTKEVEVKVNSHTIKYYESLGYQIPLRKASKSSFQHTGREYVYDLNNTFMVKVEDLSRRSNEKIDAVCDCCGKIISGVFYEHYCEQVEKFGEYVCSECKTLHYRESCLRTYGVDNTTKLKDVQDKMSITSLQKYGTKYPMQSPEVKSMARQTCIDTYGCSNPSQSPDVREKISQTLYKNGTTPTSRQQMHIYRVYNTKEFVKLNFPISCYNADICFLEEKLVVEIDFGGHDLQVKTGKTTQEEFNRKELIRNNVIKREGYKQMRIISTKDKLPSDDVLLQMLQDARQYFSDFPNHSWIEFNIDTSSVRNAENKNGIPYDYGVLRTIKK